MSPRQKQQKRKSNLRLLSFIMSISLDLLSSVLLPNTTNLVLIKAQWAQLYTYELFLPILT